MIRKPRKPLLRLGVSILAMSAAGYAGATFAQDAAATDSAAPADDAQQVVVVGVRRSLKTAQQIKKDADTVVDSITATDIGAFPDKSVAEALQRVAGITVTRFAATGDTAHFSAEPSGVLVRGLQQVRSEFNGRDTFSANSSRGLSWGDVSPELMSGVDTYKNQTAELIEGGIAGSINLRTRVPFDSKGRLMALSADVSYGDISTITTPDVSGIYTNRWDTEMGEFGVMANFAYSRVVTASEGIQLGRMGTFCKNAPAWDGTHAITLNADGTVPCTDSGYGTSSWAYVPPSVAYRSNTYDRVRKGVAFAAQWQNHDHTMLATLQYNDSQYTNEWHERVVTGTAFGLWAVPAYNPISNQPFSNTSGGTSGFTFAKDGTFQTGVMTSPMGWWGNPSTDPYNSDSSKSAKNSYGRELVHACYGWDGCSPAIQGGGLNTATRFNHNDEYTRDFSGNFKWDINDHMKANFDVQYVKSEVTNYDMEADLNSFANIGFDFTGDYPKLQWSAPTNIELSPGAEQNANNYYINALMDHTENSAGHEFATRADLQYDFEDGWLDSLKVGVRYADREQDINWSTYNWHNVANTWTGQLGNGHTQSEYFNLDSKLNPQGTWEVNGVGNAFMGGGLIPDNSGFIYLKMATVADQQGLASLYSKNAVPYGSWLGDGWTPVCERANVVPGTCYTLPEVMSISEKTTAAYVQLKFGGPDKELFGFPVSGNVGVRYVQTVDESTGGNSFPLASSWQGYYSGIPGQYANAAAACAAPIPQGSTSLINAICLLETAEGAKIKAFSNGATVVNTAHATHINWLPSFNMKVNLTDQWILRFAASRSMSRPDLGYLKNYINVGFPTLDTTANSQYAVFNANKTQITGYNFVPTAGAGNPYLKSTTADQFDLVLEDYFASVGSFSFDLFYKKFHDYIEYGTYTLPMTNNGVTETVKVSGPVNGEGAAVKGFEVSYQRFFDFLPSPFNGLGIQANYTKVVNSGVASTNLSNVSGGGNVNQGGGGNGAGQVPLIDPHALEGLSPDSYNLIVMYEKGPWALRAAYNWRSTFLVTKLDCCVGLPVWQKDAGYLDGSIRYKVSDNIELNLQGSNLLGTDTVLTQQVFGDIPGVTPNAKPVFTPNAWFKNDRRVQLGIRLKY